MHMSESCQVTVYRLSSGRPAFVMQLYGVSASDARIIGGLNPFVRALRCRGLDPDEYTASIFDVEDVRPYDPLRWRSRRRMYPVRGR